VVRMSVALSQNMNRITPGSVKRFVEKRFENPRAFLEGVDPKDAPAFDMIRASVNLVVASTLIALGTSLKLPLSTTYVTFMVAMATSLSDRAWGKDSAVYRVTGVFIVIAGWFLTALTAFVISALFASILHLTGPIGTIVLVALAVFSVVRTQVIFRRRERTRSKSEDQATEDDKITEHKIADHCSSRTISILEKVPVILNSTYDGLAQNNLRQLRKTSQEISDLNAHVRQEKASFPHKIEKFPDSFLETGSYYIQVLDYLKEVGNCLTFIARPSLEHVDNNHQEILDIQKEELAQIGKSIADYFRVIDGQLKSEGLNDSEQIRLLEHALVEQIEKIKKKQIKRIKSGESKTRNTILYLNILEETRKMCIYTHSVIKALDELNKTRP
jgi:type III secretory pathway component EscV